MSDIVNNKRYFEAILMGTSARKTKEEIARRGLLDLDRIEHVLRIHKATTVDGAQKCVNCKSNFPCQTTRALTGE